MEGKFMSPRCLEIAILLQRGDSDRVAGGENADTTSWYLSRQVEYLGFDGFIILISLKLA